MHVHEPLGTDPLETADDPLGGSPVSSACDLARAGRIVEALAELAALQATSEPSDLDRALLLATAIECRLARGDLAEAMTLAKDLTPHLDLPGVAGAIAHHAKGELASALGDPDLAITHFTTVGDLLAGGPEHPDLLPWRANAALAKVRAGHRREAALLAHEHLRIAQDSGSAYAVGQALRTLAIVDTRGDRQALLGTARSELAGLRADRLAAQIDTDLAGLLLLRHDEPGNAEALVLLRAAEEYAGRQELWPLQGRVRRLLDRLGQEPRRVQSEALAALTASERRVARLAADGMTNRQIAEELVVTVKAIEWHLSHVYRKLGIASRTRLAATLGASV